MIDRTADTSDFHNDATYTRAPAPIRIGSEAHKTLFCRTLLEAMDVGVAELIDICLAEPDRRLRLYDGPLLRPRTAPFMVRLARRFMRAKGSAPTPA